MNEIKDRILLFIERLNLSKSEFERRSGLSNGYLNNFKGSLGAKKLEGILYAYPMLSKDWLLNGEGDMLTPTNVNSVSVKGNGNTSVAGVGNQITTANLTEMIELQKGYQEMLKTSQEQITKLIELINEKLK